MNNKKNVASTIILQFAIMIHGLILPRLILRAFGSEVNGLISSITQFLSFISLLEGGLGAVVLSELYLPIEEHNDFKIRQIMGASQKFFNKLGIIFIVYTIILSIVYPLFIVKEFSVVFTSTMIYILSLSTLTQYLFSITYKLYLQADQKLYVVNSIMTVTIVTNTLSVVIIILVFPNIHVVKLCSGLIYLLQSIAFRYYVDDKYKLSPKINIRRNTGVLKNRWSGFSQNLAHFINMNTDVAIITLFLPLYSVSIYAIYLLAINALRNIICSIGNSYQSALGKYVAEGNIKSLNYNFSKFEKAFWFIGTVAFSTCLLLINPFVAIYTQGIRDAYYFQPVFAVVIVIANAIYVVREPYRLLILAAGKFKETNWGSIIEATINFVLSLALVKKLELVGVAIGTLVAMIFRTIYFIWYLRKDVLFRKYRYYLVNFFSFVCALSVNLVIYNLIDIQVTGILIFFVYGASILIFNILLYGIIYSLFSLLLKSCKNI